MLYGLLGAQSAFFRVETQIGYGLRGGYFWSMSQQKCLRSHHCGTGAELRACLLQQFPQTTVVFLFGYAEVPVDRHHGILMGHIRKLFSF